MAHGVDARGGLRGDDPPVAVGDHDGRLIARGQDLPDRGDILGQPGSLRTHRLTVSPQLGNNGASLATPRSANAHRPGATTTTRP